MLFNGHPEVILGINFALPPCYKMEAGAAAKNPSAAKKSRQSIVEEGEDELQRHIRDLGIPFRFRDPTLGDGNCWLNACCDQVNKLMVELSINDTVNI